MSQSSSSSPPSRKRQHKPKFQLESIHVDELLNAAGMSGYLGVLDAPASSPKHLERFASEMLEEMSHGESAPPERYQALLDQVNKAGIPETGIPQEAVPDRGIAELIAQKKASTLLPVTGIPVVGVPEKGIPVFKLPLPRRPIRQAVLVQDGHSLGEQRVYETLWEHAHPHQEDTRVITVGYRTLSSLCGLTVNNCKANLISLASKLAIQEVTSHSPVQGKTYLIYSYNQILRRRRQAGLTHYIKTRGVTFVSPESGEEISLLGIPEKGTPVIEIGIPPSDNTGIPVSGTQTLDNSLGKEWVPSPSDVSVLSQRLSEAGAASFDDDALRQLITTCRHLAPDATIQEIASLTLLKLAQLDPRRVRNTTGYLLTAVPRCFEGTLLDRFRQDQQKKGGESATPFSPEGTWLELRRMLEDPTSTEDDRLFARRLLGEEN